MKLHPRLVSRPGDLEWESDVPGIVKVGPKGYIHGWIYVGVGAPDDNTGMDVIHPNHGLGKVTGIKYDRDGQATHADVTFSRHGDQYRVEYHDRNDLIDEADQTGVNSRNIRGKLTGPGLYQVRDLLTGAGPADPDKPGGKLSTFDKTPKDAMERLQAGLVSAEAAGQTFPKLTPKPYDVGKDPQEHLAVALHLPEPPLGHAIYAYMKPSTTVNKDIRSGNLTEDEKNIISTLDQELAKEKVVSKTTVFRGFTAPEDVLAKMTPGSTFSDKAYTSTASDPLDARNFAVLRTFGHVSDDMPDVHAHGGKSVIQKITVPAGGHMIMGDPTVSEYILPRNTVFTVTDVSWDGSIISVTAGDPLTTDMPSVGEQLYGTTKSQKRYEPHQVERLAGTADEIDFLPDKTEKRFNPLEHRDLHGKWAVNGEPSLTLGDPKTARHVVTYVPGIHSSTPEGQERQAKRLQALKSATGSNDTAYVLWKYNAPDNNVDGMLRGSAHATAGRLKNYQDQLRADNPDAHLTVIGHSYGSLVAGEAARIHGMKPDDLVLMGSPGSGSKHVSELGVDPDHVWVGAEKRDNVPHHAEHLDFGGSPAHHLFGARRFAANHPAKEIGNAHGSYFKEGSEALPNLAAIVTGNYGNVTLHEASKVRRVDTNGQVIDIAPEDDGSYPAAGGGARSDPDDPHLGELAPGGSVPPSAGGEPPRWHPSDNLVTWSKPTDGAGRAGVNPGGGGTLGIVDDGSDQTHASKPESGNDASQGATGVPPPKSGTLCGPDDGVGMWPPGTIGTGQPQTSSIGGTNAVPPSSSVITDGDDEGEVTKAHGKDAVYQQLLKNYPPKAIAWVKNASWSDKPVLIDPDDFDTDAIKTWAASHQKARVNHFIRKIKAGKHVNPVVAVQEPGDGKVKAVAIDGHHRYLAYKALGQQVPSWLGKVNRNGGPWDETHVWQFHQGSDPANKESLVSQASVDYRAATDAEHRCGTCVMFRSDAIMWGTCTLVKGRIHASAVCDRWYPVTEAELEKLWHFNPLESRGLHGEWSRTPGSHEVQPGSVPNVQVGRHHQINMSKMEGVDPDLKNEVAQRVREFARQFPGAASSLTSIETGPLPDNVMASTNRNRETGLKRIVLNQRYYGNKDFFESEMARMHNEGFHPLPTTQFIIDHELGHVLDEERYGGEGDLPKVPSSAFVFSPDGQLAGRLGKYSGKNQMEVFGSAFGIWEAAHSEPPAGKMRLSSASEQALLGSQAIKIIDDIAAGRAPSVYKQENITEYPEWTCDGFVSDPRPTEKGWKGTYLHELRGPDGRWIKDGETLMAAATGRKAGAVRLHDHVLYHEPVATNDGYGFRDSVRPMEVTHLAHHWEGTGKSRKRFTDMTLTDEDGGERQQTVKDGSPLKIFPREQVAASARPPVKPVARPPAPKPLPVPKPEPVARPVEHPAPKPVPEPVSRPSHRTLTGAAGHFGHISVLSDSTIPDPAQKASAIADAQSALDLQGKFVPKIAGQQFISLNPTLGEAEGQTLAGGMILINPYVANAVGNVTKAVKGLTPDELQKRDEGLKWWVPSDPQYSLMDTTVAHEEGHVIHDDLPDSVAYDPDFWQSMSKAMNIRPPSLDPYSIQQLGKTNVMNSWLLSNFREIKESVSQYATSNFDEFRAELWSEYTMNAKPREPARLYGNYITDQLSKRGQL